MTDTLPDPPVPADADLSRLEYMPLVIAKLRRSATWLRAKRRPEIGFYLINLWTAAWLEKPAGSLANDDDILADAAMCSPEKWDEVKDDVLRGFKLHSDGRLYHGFLAGEVVEALEKRAKWRDKKRDQRGTGGGHDEKSPPRPRGQAGETPLRDGTGRDGTTTPTPPPIAPDAATAVVDAFLRMRSELWPSESRLPAPSLTLKTQAGEFISAGAPVELVLEVIERVMRQNLAKGDSAPTSLMFCRLSMQTATRNHVAGVPAEQRAATAAPTKLTPAQERAYFRAMEDHNKLTATERREKPTPKPEDFLNWKEDAA